jgi:hypothetical protein
MKIAEDSQPMVQANAKRIRTVPHRSEGVAPGVQLAVPGRISREEAAQAGKWRCFGQVHQPLGTRQRVSSRKSR